MFVSPMNNVFDFSDGSTEPTMIIKVDINNLEKVKNVIAKDKVSVNLKGSWTKQEDELLLELVTEYGAKKWSNIARHIRGRVGKQCRERYLNHLDPTLNHNEWTAEEDEMIINLHRSMGNTWAKIAKHLKGRTPNRVKNRWNSSLCKREDELEEIEERNRNRDNLLIPNNMHINNHINDDDMNHINDDNGNNPLPAPAPTGDYKSAPLHVQFRSCPQQQYYDKQITNDGVIADYFGDEDNNEDEIMRD